MADSFAVDDQFSGEETEAWGGRQAFDRGAYARRLRALAQMAAQAGPVAGRPGRNAGGAPYIAQGYLRTAEQEHVPLRLHNVSAVVAARAGHLRDPEKAWRTWR